MTRSDRSETADPPAEPRRPLPFRLLVLLIRIALAAILLQAGIGKLIGLSVTVEMFADLGGAPMRYTVGLLETAGAVGVLIPILSGVAAIGVSALFMIIVTVQLSSYGPSVIGLAVITLLLAVAISILQRVQTVRVLRLLRRALRPNRAPTTPPHNTEGTPP